MSTPPRGEGWRPGDPHGSGPPWQQGPWLHPPGPPPPTGNGLKWLLGAVAVLLVIAIAVGITVIVMSRGGDSGPAASPTGAVSDIASANDTGPVSIITSEPTCSRLVSISNSLLDIQKQGWGDLRASLGPASEWTSDQRQTVEAVGTAMRNAADQSIDLLKQTPHRVLRELYEQFVVYGRAYADNIQDYSPSDDALASANVNAGSAIIGICNTITYGSASRGVAMEAVAKPTKVASIGDPANPERFIKGDADSTCTDWIGRLDQFNERTTQWADADPSTPASDWNSDRRVLEQSVQPLIRDYAGDVEALGRESQNPILADFAGSAALYLRAYLTVGSNYTLADGWLSSVGFKFANLVSGACRAAAR